MVRGLNSSAGSDLDWLAEFTKDFRRRFTNLLSFKFREFGSVMALSIIGAADEGIKKLEDHSNKGERRWLVGIQHLFIDDILCPFLI